MMDSPLPALLDGSEGLTRRRSSILVEEIASTIMEGIISGAFPPGAQLQLRPLADLMETSVMPIREALASLANIGLVENRPRRGAYVPMITLDDALSTYAARLLIEPELIALAAATFPKSFAARSAEQALEAQIEALGHGNNLVERSAHRAFHWAIYTNSNSAWLLQAARGPYNNSERYRVLIPPTEHSGDDHHRMFEACMAGPDGADEAANLLRKHLNASVERIRTRLARHDAKSSESKHVYGEPQESGAYPHSHTTLYRPGE